MKAYYNEWDPKAAAWLRQLIKNGFIADGIVDERSITEVSEEDLRGFTQHHFFAGIGGWSYALRRAGWDDSIPVWTSSLPCQPFSTAGKNLGKADERHLLPYFIELVRQFQPDRIFGEQIEGAIKHGWLDDLQTTMEAEGYTVGHCVLGAHSVGSFHKRQRLYWVADSQSQRFNWGKDTTRITGWKEFKSNGTPSSLSNTSGERLQEQQSISGVSRQAHDGIQGKGFKRGGSMGDANSNGFQSRIEATKTARYWNTDNSTDWDDPEWIHFRDNKCRPIKPGIKPLVNGLPTGLGYSSDPSESINADETQEARGMRLKGYGNAIVPTVSEMFIKAFMEVA